MRDINTKTNKNMLEWQKWPSFQPSKVISMQKDVSGTVEMQESPKANTTFLLDKPHDPGHQQTTAADHWAQPPSFKQSWRQHQKSWPMCVWQTGFNPQAPKSGGRAKSRREDTRSNESLTSSAPSNRWNAIQTYPVSSHPYTTLVYTFHLSVKLNLCSSSGAAVV